MEVVLEPNIASDPKKKTFLDDPQWPEHNILVDKIDTFMKTISSYLPKWHDHEVGPTNKYNNTLLHLIARKVGKWP